MSEGSATAELNRVRAAAARKTRAAVAYRTAVIQARQAGCSHGAIGRAAGVSRQAVEQLTRRSTEGGKR